MTFSLTMDAADPARLGQFWATALGYRREDPPGGFSTWEEALTSWGLPEERWNDANAHALASVGRRQGQPCTFTRKDPVTGRPPWWTTAQVPSERSRS